LIVRLVLSFAAAVWSVVTPLRAVEPERDFSGNWILVESRSDSRRLKMEPEPFLTVQQDEQAVRCKSVAGDTEVSWSYRLNGSDSKYAIAGESRNSAVKWEGAALLVNTLVDGARNYTIMDRWRLSPDRATLTITRQVVQGAGEAEGRLVYRRAGARAAEEPTAVSAPPERPAPQILTPRPAVRPPVAGEAVVPAGTRVLLELVNALNTGRSKPGESVYLRTVVPVAVNDQIVIPPGSTVLGTITEGRTVKGRRDLYIRFDTLTLPDGRTRDLRSRPDGPGEGKVAGHTDPGGEVRTVTRDTAIGASIGTLAGAASGHTLAGLGIGGLAGAAAGLGSVLTDRKNVTLPRGTHVEMVTDRELRF
jgi:type IV secretion system protein VirB10